MAKRPTQRRRAGWPEGISAVGALVGAKKTPLGRGVEKRAECTAGRGYFLAAARWARSTTRNIWIQCQNTPLMQPAVSPPQSVIIFGSVDGT